MTASEEPTPLLIKRYASRRLYNTETSDYVTLEDIAGVIRTGREVRIVDLKSGEDLTRSYLLQIIAEHESRGDAVLPLGVLTDLVRSYTGAGRTVVPDFLAASFEMLRSGQSQALDTMTAMNPMTRMPGFEAMRANQRAFLDALTGGMAPWSVKATPAEPGDADAPERAPPSAREDGGSKEELDAIRAQLAEMQAVLSKMKKD